MPVLLSYPELPALSHSFSPDETAFSSTDFSWSGTDWRVTSPVAGVWYAIQPLGALGSDYVTRLAFVANTLLETGQLFSARVKDAGGAVLATVSGVADAVSPCWSGRTCVPGSHLIDITGIDAPDGIASIELRLDSGAASYLSIIGDNPTGNMVYEVGVAAAEPGPAFQCNAFAESAFVTDCPPLFVGPQPEWPENETVTVECGSITVHDLLSHLNSPFDRGANHVLLFRLDYDGAMTWRIADGRFATTVSGGTGASLDIDLAAYTVGELVAHLSAQIGYSIVYSDPSWADYSALMLLDGSGDPDTSNGDHVYGYTSLLWSYLSAVALALKTSKRAICQMLMQMDVNTASDTWLDHLGGYYAVPRLLGESDARYGPRIIAETLRPKGNNIAIAAAIATATGQPAAVVDAGHVSGLGEARYHNGVHLRDGSITYGNGGLSSFASYGLFDVEVAFDALGDADFSAYRDAIVAQVNRLRDAGTFLRQITITGSSALEDEDASEPGDDLTITFTLAAHHDGAHKRNGLITYGGLASPIELI